MFVLFVLSIPLIWLIASYLECRRHRPYCDCEYCLAWRAEMAEKAIRKTAEKES